jgi:arginine decarboxylase
MRTRRQHYVEEVLPAAPSGKSFLTQWDTNEIARRMKSQVDAAIKSDRLKPSEAMRLLDDYEGPSAYLSQL